LNYFLFGTFELNTATETNYALISLPSNFFLFKLS